MSLVCGTMVFSGSANKAHMPVRKALIIDTPHIDRILDGSKCWEMRSTDSKVRGRIALIRKKSGTVIGTAELVATHGPLNRQQMLANVERHRIDASRIESGAVDKWVWAWELRNVLRLAEPVQYRHPNGAVIWVNLDDEVAVRLD